MSIQFPSLKPSERNFALGAFPVKSYRSLSGIVTKRSFGNKPFGFTLDLSFNNISDDNVTLILSHYNSTLGGFSRFSLPNSLFSGMSSTLKEYIQAPSSIKWEYASPPSIQSVFVNRSTVEVKLIGEIT